jgi:hypothetical protein
VFLHLDTLSYGWDYRMNQKELCLAATQGSPLITNSVCSLFAFFVAKTCSFIYLFLYLFIYLVISLFLYLWIFLFVNHFYILCVLLEYNFLVIFIYSFFVDSLFGDWQLDSVHTFDGRADLWRGLGEWILSIGQQQLLVSFAWLTLLTLFSWLYFIDFIFLIISVILLRIWI